MGLHKAMRRTLLRTLSPRARAARMDTFVRAMRLAPGVRILDLGGTTKLWKFVEIPLNITVLNLATQEIDEHRYGAHTFRIVRGDATDVAEYADNSFDMVFSNSCIEHVGPADKQAAFAREVRRLAPAYYVQTPSRAFPIEAHTNLPYWFFYPEGVRAQIIASWRRKDPGYADFVEGTRVLTATDLRRLFPDGELIRERYLGFTKSNTVYRRGALP